MSEKELKVNILGLKLLESVYKMLSMCEFVIVGLKISHLLRLLAVRGSYSPEHDQLYTHKL